MRTMSLALTLTLVVATVGCGEQQAQEAQPPPAAREHLWQEQTDSLDKARQVEDRLREGAERQKQTAE